jgi:hypothetical protein
MACIYSRVGFGEQTITFQIDGSTVYHNKGFAAGNLKERITWGSEGRSVRFHVDGLDDHIYDAISRIRINESGGVESQTEN